MALSSWQILVPVEVSIQSSHIQNILPPGGIEPQNVYFVMELTTTKWIFGELVAFFTK
jgi:hypothetical protein